MAAIGMNSSSFSYTEEAFLLRSLQEVVMVWKRGIGQANFNLQVKDGKSDIQLSFQLGQPGEPHLYPPDQKKVRFKTAKQRQRDNVRAAAYQAGKASSADQASSSDVPSGDPPAPTPQQEAESAANTSVAATAAPPSAAPADASPTTPAVPALA